MREDEENPKKVPATLHYAVMTAVAKSKLDFLHNVKRQAGVILGRPVQMEEVKEAFLEAGEDLGISLAGAIRFKAQSVCPPSRTGRYFDLEAINARLDQLEMAQNRMTAEERINGRSVTETCGESVPVHVIESSGSGLSFPEQREELTSPDEPSMNNCQQKVSSTSTTTIPRHRVFPSPAPIFGACSTQLFSETWSSELKRMDSQRATDEDGKVDRIFTRNHGSSFFARSAIHERAPSSDSFRSSSELPFSAPSMRQSKTFPSYSESSTSPLFMNPGPVSMFAVPNQSANQLSLSHQPPIVATSPVPNYRLATIKDRYPKPVRRCGEHFPVFIASILPNGFYTVPVDGSMANQIKTEIARWLKTAIDSLQEVSEEEFVDGLPVLYVGKGEKQRAIVMKPKDGERVKVRCVDTGASHHARPHELRHIAATLVNSFSAQAQRCSLNIPDYYKDAHWPSKVLLALREGVHARNKYTCIHLSYYEDENLDEWATVDIKRVRGGSFIDFFLRCVEE